MQRSIAVLLPGLALGLWSTAMGEPAPTGSSHATGADTTSAMRADVPTLTLPVDAVNWRSFHLRRAVMAWSEGDLGQAAGHLERLDFTDPTLVAFPHHDRAAFLLAHAYRRLGNRDGLGDLAETVSHWPERSDYVRWIRHAALELDAGDVRSPRTLGAGAGGTDFAVANALVASFLLEAGQAREALFLVERMSTVGASKDLELLVTWIRARALSATGADERPVLETVSEADTTHQLGRELRGAAAMKLAAMALADGSDPQPYLDRVPVTSSHGPEARHLMGRLALEAGDPERAASLLEGIGAADLDPATSREVAVARGAECLDQGDWARAYARYRDADDGWLRTRTQLESWRTAEPTDMADALWGIWDRSARPDAVLLDPRPAAELADSLARVSTDLRGRPELSTPMLVPVAPDRTRPLVSPPSLEDRRAVAHATGRLVDAGYELSRIDAAIAAELEHLARLRAYLERGHHHLGDEFTRMAAQGAGIDSVLSDLESLLTQLEDVRARSVERIAVRTARLMAWSQRNQLWMAAMRRFHVDGPNRSRAEARPEGIPAAGEVLTEEQELSQWFDAFVTAFADRGPELVNLSAETTWRPLLVQQAARLDSMATRQREWLDTMTAELDSSLVSGETSARLRSLQAARDRQAQQVAALAQEFENLRMRVAGEALDGALAALDREREAIDYGLTAATYQLAVAAASTFEDEATTSENAALRVEAIERFESFIGQYPGSFARGEARFRLADLYLLRARDEFREKMAAFIGEHDLAAADATRALVPFVDYQPALDLYLTILEEDPDFPHQDAVLFNAGMILSDEADPRAGQFLEDLVSRFPDSPHAQEAWLRMADLRFEDKRFADSVPLYENAALGAENGFTAIALYKMGWAHFNEDRFEPAAGAFRRLLDLYQSGEEVEVGTDLRTEAEDYLIHALARAGGAEVFARYFDGLGRRDYEPRLLHAMAQLLRRFSLYGEAIDADELWVARFPNEPEALVSVTRIVETWERWNKPEKARAARLAYAPFFAPGSPWHATNDTLPVAAEGEEFARSSWKRIALEHHHQARGEAGTPEDWQTAFDLYETLLRYWPDHAETPSLHLHAGEAANQLGRYATSYHHYTEAATSDTASFAVDAQWQRLAVADAWYRSTSSPSATGGGATDGDLTGSVAAAPSSDGSGAPYALGTDSLAVRVIESAHDFVTRFPLDARGCDARWRAGNLAFGHAWYESAAEALASLPAACPDDERAPVAASLRADSFYRLRRFDAAGPAYEMAASAAQRAGLDSLATRLRAAVPVCYYQHADSLATTDTGDPLVAPARFEEVATRWPAYEHAALAQYRAGLMRLEHGTLEDGVVTMETLIRVFPDSEYGRDAHLAVAQAWEGAGRREEAARAYTRFADRYPGDQNAADALLTSADLLEAAGQTEGAETTRLQYIARHPGDMETAMAILDPLARRDLAAVGTDRPIGSFLTTRKVTATAPADSFPSHLARYLVLGSVNPTLAAPEIEAEVRFLEAETAYGSYMAVSLTQPLDTSIQRKQALLETMLAAYRRAAELGVAEWAHAAAFRIGQALVAFGSALEASERPADLSEDDLYAYEDVIFEQAWEFYGRGEEVWTDLLRQKQEAADPGQWVSRSRDALWGRLALRFLHQPEVEFPVVPVDAPPQVAVADDPAELTGSLTPVADTGTDHQLGS